MGACVRASLEAWPGSGHSGLTSLQSKLEKSLEHLRKQMEDALLFQAQAEETCSLWQAGGQAPSVGRDGGMRDPTPGPCFHIQPHAAPEAALLLQTPCMPRVN